MRDETIAAISANIPNDVDVSQQEEDIQLEEAIAKLSPVEELKAQREQEKLDIQRLKEEERQAARLEELKERAKNGDDKAKKELEIAQREQAKKVITGTADAFKNVQDQAFKTAEKAQNVASDAWVSVGRIATPGSIWLPIAVLFIFFLLIIPINGYSRFQWLWLAVFGNAKIDGGGSGSGGPVQPRTYTGVSVV